MRFVYIQSVSIVHCRRLLILLIELASSAPCCVRGVARLVAIDTAMARKEYKGSFLVSNRSKHCYFSIKLTFVLLSSSLINAMFIFIRIGEVVPPAEY